ncbi:MAG: ATP-dependent DNA helicase RecG [Gammaproteobacteria bacterium]
MKLLKAISCNQLRGVGSRTAESLAASGIHNIFDLLLHLPARYQNETKLTAIKDVVAEQYTVVRGTITQQTILNKTGHQKNSLICRLQDDSGELIMRFFHVYPPQLQVLREGAIVECAGVVKRMGKNYELAHPEYVDASRETLVKTHLTPIYGLMGNIKQRAMQQFMQQALILLMQDAANVEILPEHVLKTLQLNSLVEALQFIHQPPAEADIMLLNQHCHPMQQRLYLEELLAHHLAIQRLHQLPMQAVAAEIACDSELVKRFLQALPFTLTSAQQQVLTDITADLQQAVPMQRLVQGDVGSGKTVVAAIAALHVIAAGYQVALMAPTEILAEQHYLALQRWLQPLGIDVLCLTGKLNTHQRANCLAQLAQGQAQIVVGTHALIQHDVVFHNLALTIIDEQHRFGVLQRQTLSAKQTQFSPHQLVMTATPIPRTLAMTLYAGLNVSIIDELPPGRQAITTVAIANHKREEVIKRVHNKCLGGEQVYWVCTAIDDTPEMQCQAAESTAQFLQQYLSDIRVGLLHGRMSSADKATIMQQFKIGEIQLLVATTVIEVGVDVPNATLMIIENPERLGLAQLHQLRGRVGRGQLASHCILLYQAPLSEIAYQRLNIMREHTDGFAISQADLMLRGPGDVLGTKQAGLLQLRVADLQRDQTLLNKVQQLAYLLTTQACDLQDALIKRWIVSIDALYYEDIL